MIALLVEGNNVISIIFRFLIIPVLVGGLAGWLASYLYQNTLEKRAAQRVVKLILAEYSKVIDGVIKHIEELKKAILHDEVNEYFLREKLPYTPNCRKYIDNVSDMGELNLETIESWKNVAMAVDTFFEKFASSKQSASLPTSMKRRLDGHWIIVHSARKALINALTVTKNEKKLKNALKLVIAQRKKELENASS